MKRDMDLCREILRRVEALPHHGDGALQIEGRSAEEISYNVWLLHDAGLIQAMDVSADDFEWWPLRLTWKGHEFLDAARNDTVWNRAKARLAQEGVGWTFELLKAAPRGTQPSDRARPLTVPPSAPEWRWRAIRPPAMSSRANSSRSG